MPNENGGSLNGRVRAASHGAAWLTALVACVGWFVSGYASHAKQEDLAAEISTRRMRDAELQGKLDQLRECVHTHIEESMALLQKQVAILERVERRVEK